MIDESDKEILEQVSKAFEQAVVPLTDLSLRRFPGEVIVIAEVRSENFERALTIASSLDNEIQNGFVSVRKAPDKLPELIRERPRSLLDPRVNDLIEILNERSRTAEHQPSLRYIRDAAQNLNIALSRRHNLIFGRRGAGKTALMVEAKKILEQRGATAFWMNVQPMRRLSAYEAFLTTVSRLCDIPALIHSTRRSNSLSVKQSAALKAKINELLTSDKISEKDVNLLLPELQQILSIFVQ